MSPNNTTVPDTTSATALDRRNFLAGLTAPLAQKRPARRNAAKYEYADMDRRFQAPNPSSN
ncbi:MAG: hypothetical protein LBD14_01750 [Puniceicoccales bacterium]|jgi:hypothetical protein|nr:hypothetical protein [Puniceicoccales bacterium]